MAEQLEHGRMVSNLAYHIAREIGMDEGYGHLCDTVLHDIRP